MRRWLLLGAAAAAVVGAVAVVAALARLNDYLSAHRDDLAAWASTALGRPVSFASIGVSLRGGGRARITDLRVGDDPRFGDGDFLRAASAVVSVSLLDAARGRLRIRAVVVDAPSVTLSRDAAGWNVDSLALLRGGPPAAQSGSPPATTVATPQAVAAAAPGAPPPFVIESIRLRNGAVAVSDQRRQPPSTLRVTQLDLSLSQPAPAAPIRVKGSAALFSSEDRNATVDGTLTPGAPATAAFDGRWDPVPLADLQAVIPALGDLAAGGRVGGDLHFAGPISRGDGGPAAVLANLTGSLTLQGLALRVPAVALPLSDLTGSLQLTPEAIDLSDTTARLGETPVAVGCRLAPPTSGVAQCRVSAASIDLRPLQLGDGTLRGVTVDASVPPFDPQPLLQATVTIADGQLGTAPFRAVAVTGSWQAGTLEIAHAAVEGFGGSADGNGRCSDMLEPTPSCTAQASLHGIQIATALAALQPRKPPQVDGRLDADIRLSASGREGATLRRSLRGNGSVRVSNGVVQGVNLAQRVLGAVPGVDKVVRSGGRAAALLGGGATRFDHLTATLRIADQRVASNDVVLNAPDFSVDGGGSVGFSGDLDARGTFRGAAPLIDDLTSGVPVLGTLVAGTKGIVTIPFTVRGTVADPKVEPNLGSVAGDISRQADAGLQALFGKPDPKRGNPGGVLRQGLDKLLGR